MKINHVIPLDDEEEHQLSESCLCKPTAKRHPEALVIVHNAYDCREFVEQAEKLPGILASTDHGRWAIYESTDE